MLFKSCERASERASALWHFIRSYSTHDGLIGVYPHDALMGVALVWRYKVLISPYKDGLKGKSTEIKGPAKSIAHLKANLKVLLQLDVRL